MTVGANEQCVGCVCVCVGGVQIITKNSVGNF